MCTWYDNNIDNNNNNNNNNNDNYYYYYYFFFFDGQKRTVMDTNFFNEYKQIRYIVLNV